MADPVDSQRLYDFDEFLTGPWNLRLLHRQSSDGRLKVTQIKGLVLAFILNYLQVTFLLIQIVQYLRSESIDWDTVVEATGLLCSISISVFQGIAHLLKRRVIERLVVNLERLFPQTRAEQEHYNLQPYANNYIRQRTITDKLCRCLTLCFISMPLLFSFFEWLVVGNAFIFRYPFRNWYPVDPQNWLFYPILYVFETIVSFFCGFYLIKDYVLNLLATGHIEMHYRHLGNMIARLDARKEEANKCSNLVRLIDFHCALDELCDDVNEIFNVTTFISFGITKLLMCLLMYSFFHGKNFIVFPILVGIFFYQVLSVFIRCSSGTAVYTASEELVNKIYDSNWYEGSPRYRRMLLLMMVRANRPVELHSLKILKIRMESFKELIMEAYQIFMILLNFAEQ